MPAHLLVAHFPLVLLVVGAATDLVGWMSGRRDLRRAAGILLILGAGAALLAFLTGQGAMERVLSRIHPGDPRLEAHAQWGAAALWALVGAGVLRALWQERLDAPHGLVLLAAALLSVAIAFGVALTGLEISHGA